MPAEYDREELTRITHSRLRPVNQFNDPGITHQEIKSLKIVAAEEQKGSVQAHRLFDRLFGGILGLFKGLFFIRPKSHNQCDLYGHVLPPGGFQGVLPKCYDCSAEIKSPDEVRGATPREQRRDDRAKDTGQQRKYVK